MFDDEPLPLEAAIVRSSHPARVPILDDLFDCLTLSWHSIRDALIPIFQQIARTVREIMCDGQPHVRHRPRNTRVQMVQAKRKRLNLEQDGKYPTLRSRKASYAFAYEVERWCEGKREQPPRPRDFEHVPARRRKREARRQLRWKPIPYSDQDRAWMAMQDATMREICMAFAISEPEIGKLSTGIVDNPGILARPATQESESPNG